MALLVKPDIPPVTQLLRGMFNAHFLMMRIAAIIRTVTFALTGRPISAVVVALVAAFVMWARAGFCRSGTPNSAPAMPAMRRPCAG